MTKCVCEHRSDGETAFRIFHLLGGSDCWKFHHVLAFTLTESLMGPAGRRGGKNGCALQLIKRSARRSCLSHACLFCGMSCLSLYSPYQLCFSSWQRQDVSVCHERDSFLQAGTSLICYSPLCEFGLWWHILVHLTILEFHRQNKNPPNGCLQGIKQQK